MSQRGNRERGGSSEEDRDFDGTVCLKDVQHDQAPRRSDRHKNTKTLAHGDGNQRLPSTSGAVSSPVVVIDGDPLSADAKSGALFRCAFDGCQFSSDKKQKLFVHFHARQKLSQCESCPIEASVASDDNSGIDIADIRATLSITAVREAISRPRLFVLTGEPAKMQKKRRDEFDAATWPDRKRLYTGQETASRVNRVSSNESNFSQVNLIDSISNESMSVSIGNIESTPPTLTRRRKKVSNEATEEAKQVANERLKIEEIERQIVKSAVIHSSMTADELKNSRSGVKQETTTASSRTKRKKRNSEEAESKKRCVEGNTNGDCCSVVSPVPASDVKREGTVAAAELCKSEAKAGTMDHASGNSNSAEVNHSFPCEENGRSMGKKIRATCQASPEDHGIESSEAMPPYSTESSSFSDSSSRIPVMQEVADGTMFVITAEAEDREALSSSATPDEIRARNAEIFADIVGPTVLAEVSGKNDGFSLTNSNPEAELITAAEVEFESEENQTLADSNSEVPEEQPKVAAATVEAVQDAMDIGIEDRKLLVGKLLDLFAEDDDGGQKNGVERRQLDPGQCDVDGEDLIDTSIISEFFFINNQSETADESAISFTEPSDAAYIESDQLMPDPKPVIEAIKAKRAIPLSIDLPDSASVSIDQKNGVTTLKKKRNGQLTRPGEVKEGRCCPFCNRPFTLKGYKSHLRAQHLLPMRKQMRPKQEYKFKCDRCSDCRLRSVAALTKHRRGHEAEETEWLTRFAQCMSNEERKKRNRMICHAIA